MGQPLPAPAPAPAPPATEPFKLPDYKAPGPAHNDNLPHANDNKPGGPKPTVQDNLPKKNTWGRILSKVAARVATRFPVIAGAGAATAATATGASALAVSRMDAAANTALHQQMGMPGPAPRYTLFTRQPLKLELGITPPPEPSQKTNVKVQDKTMAQKKQEGREIIKNGNFSPSTDAQGRPPALWMGGTDAEAAAHNAGHSTLGDTAGGKQIADHIKNEDMDYNNSRQLWRSASKKYTDEVAKQVGAGGKVDAFLKGNNPYSIFRSVEAPNLLGKGVGINPHVVP